MKTVVRNSKSKGTNAKENMVLVQQTSNCKTKETPNFILQWPTQQSMRSTKIKQTYIKEFSKKPLPKSKGTNAKENMVLVQQTSNCKTKEAPNFILQWPTQQSMRSAKIQQTYIKEFSKKPLPNYNSKHLYKFLNHSNKSSNPDPAHQQNGLPTITPQPLLGEWNIKWINESLVVLKCRLHVYQNLSWTRLFKRRESHDWLNTFWGLRWKT
jgi:BarA-like signal transduction histidine kinase